MDTIKKRYDFVDLAKGFCILFVMSIHITDQTVFSVPYISSFRMPFYFFICGLFLKTADPLKIFLRKKINALLIPFITFELIAFFWQTIGYIINSNLYPKVFFKLINPWNCVNGPLWFLLCLFWAYMIFMLISKIRICRNIYIMGIIIVVISLASFYISSLKFRGHLFVMPFFISSSITSLIFIYLGYFLKQKMQILEKNKYDWFILLVSLTIFSVTQYLLGASSINFEWNQFGQSYIQTVTAGLTGGVSILFICKFIGRLPILSYIGRYSIIALGLHSLFLEPIWALHLNPYMSILLLLLLLMPCMFFFKKYLPKYCAQEPFLKI